MQWIFNSFLKESKLIKLKQDSKVKLWLTDENEEKKEGRKKDKEKAKSQRKLLCVFFFRSTETNDSLSHVNNLDVHTNTALCDFFPNVEENLDSHTVTI